MRLATSLIILAALAGCNRDASSANNMANTANAAAAAPAAPAPAPVPSAPAAPADAALAEFRTETLAGCLEGGQEAGAPAASTERFCTCAVDRTMAGRSLASLEAETQANTFEARFQSELDACIAETGN